MAAPTKNWVLIHVTNTTGDICTLCRAKPFDSVQDAKDFATERIKLNPQYQYILYEAVYYGESAEPQVVFGEVE